jgi:hypothetical protein
MNIPPAEQRPGRHGTLVMIAAHAVYGATSERSAGERNEMVSDPDICGSRYGSTAREV